jgi:hypothetical protein
LFHKPGDLDDDDERFYDEEVPFQTVEPRFVSFGIVLILFAAAASPNESFLR